VEVLLVVDKPTQDTKLAVEFGAWYERVLRQELSFKPLASISRIAEQKRRGVSQRI